MGIRKWCSEWREAQSFRCRHARWQPMATMDCYVDKRNVYPPIAGYDVAMEFCNLMKPLTSRQIAQLARTRPGSLLPWSPEEVEPCRVAFRRERLPRL